MKFADVQRLLLEDGEKNKQSVPKDVQKKIIATARQLVVKNNKNLGRLITPAEIERCVDAAIKHFGFQPASPEAAGIRKAAIKRQQEYQSKHASDVPAKTNPPSTPNQQTSKESPQVQVSIVAANLITKNREKLGRTLTKSEVTQCVDAAMKQYKGADGESVRNLVIDQQTKAQELLAKKQNDPNRRQPEKQQPIDKIAPYGWNARTGKEFKSQEERDEFRKMIDREQQGIKTRTMRNGQWHND